MNKKDLKNKLLETNIFNDNKYLDEYIRLILLNINNECVKGKTQRHHIIPRYFFQYNNLDVDNSQDNIVNLYYKDHLLAHYYLGCCSKDEFIYKNLLAMRYIDGEFNLNSLDNYQELYEKSRVNIYEKTHSVIANSKISETLKGKSFIKGKTWGKHTKKSRKNPNAKNKLLSDYASLRVGEKNSFYGKTHSEYTKSIISQKRTKYIDIGMYDLNSKELILKFRSIPEVVDYIKTNNISSSSKSAISSRVRSVCKLNTDYNRAYGYNWRYL